MARRTTPSSSHLLDLAVWTVALWASFLNLLNFNHYPLFRPEVGLTLIGLALIGALLGAVQQLARPRLSFLFIALFATVMVDLNAPIDLNWLYVVWFVLALAAFFAEHALLKVILAAFTAVLLFQLTTLITGFGGPVRSENMAQNRQAPGGRTATRPVIVHLVLDSYLGLDGMALGPDVYRQLRAEQTAFFIEHGFQIYPRAYSRHPRTMNSLPYLFSYGATPPAVHFTNAEYAVPEELPYFDDLDKRGYRTSAVLPAYFDLCVKQKLTHCHNFETSALTSMLGTKMSVFDRSKVFGFTLLHLAIMPSRVAWVLQLAAENSFGSESRWFYNRSKLFPLASLREMERFTADLHGLQPGEARIAHFLLPHDPYILSADCTVKPARAWLDEHGPGAEIEREKAYADQVRCVQNQLANVLATLDRTPAGRNAIVLIHGDHGSRITPAMPYLGGPKLSQREMLMSHSTLFAVRVPGEAAGEIAGTHALDELMADFRRRDFASAPRPKAAPARVLIMDANWDPREWRSLPDFSQ